MLQVGVVLFVLVCVVIYNCTICQLHCMLLYVW
jgi:hypothetical protein